MFQNYHFLLCYKPKTPPDFAIFDAQIVVDLLPTPILAPFPAIIVVDFGSSGGGLRAT
jgi:hypothetical protein